jgi:hypothetical protein
MVGGPLFRRTISRADVASPTPATEDPALDWSLLFLEPISFGAKLVDLVEHPFQQRFSRSRRNPGSLKLSDFTALTMNLGTHPLSLLPDIIKLHDVLARPKPSQAAGGQRFRSDLPVGEAAAGSKDG